MSNQLQLDNALLMWCRLSKRDWKYKNEDENTSCFMCSINKIERLITK